MTHYRVNQPNERVERESRQSKIGRELAVGAANLRHPQEFLPQSFNVSLCLRASVVNLFWLWLGHLTQYVENKEVI